MPAATDYFFGAVLLGPIFLGFLDDGLSSLKRLLHEFGSLSSVYRIVLFLAWMCFRNITSWLRLVAVAECTILEDISFLLTTAKSDSERMRKLWVSAKSIAESSRRCEALLKMVITAIGKQMDEERARPNDFEHQMLRPDQAEEVGMPVGISEWTLQQVLLR